MATEIKPLTADELLHLPNNGMRRELVKGELREMTPAGYNHGRVAAAMPQRVAAWGNNAL